MIIFKILRVLNLNLYEAQVGTWPWIVSFAERGTRVCAGSVIHDRWILTAEHCFETKKWLLPFGDFVVSLKYHVFKNVWLEYLMLIFRQTRKHMQFMNMVGKIRHFGSGITTRKMMMLNFN